MASTIATTIHQPFPSATHSPLTPTVGLTVLGVDVATIEDPITPHYRVVKLMKPPQII